MTFDPLPMLFGAALVALGVLVGAIADRIRGNRRERAQRAPRLVGDGTATNPLRVESTSAHDAMAKDVIATIVAAGYPRKLAAEAVHACSGSQTSTIESWVRAALKRCAPEGART